MRARMGPGSIMSETGTITSITGKTSSYEDHCRSSSVVGATGWELESKHRSLGGLVDRRLQRRGDWQSAGLARVFMSIFCTAEPADISLDHQRIGGLQVQKRLPSRQRNTQAPVDIYNPLIST
ncbi:hypothetical protein CHU98_g5280 [Xylaria longipes]|nr:hypothetical protein CHU98_g5280 [Xylaria longipes]